MAVKKKASKKAASKKLALVDQRVVAKEALKEAHKDLKANRTKRIVVEDGSIEIIEELDRSWAELLLANLHEDQRQLRPLHLGRIERALKEDKFEWTGDSIRIDENLNVIDGQHRLTAVLNTGIPLKNAILITLKTPSVIKVIDTTSAPRSLGDIFKVHGQSSINNTVAAAIVYETSNFIKRSTRELSKPEKYDLLRSYDLAEEATALYNAGQRGMRITSGPLAGALRCVRKNHDLAMRFFEAAFSNTHYIEQPSKDFPDQMVQVPCAQVAVLSNWLIHVREQQKLGTGRTSGEEFITEGAAKAILAWNAFRSGKHLTKLQMPRTGVMPTPRK